MNIAGYISVSAVDYPDKISSVLFTSPCNFKCGYCHNPEFIRNKKSIMPTEELMKELTMRRKIIQGVVITGGEPTLQKDLPEFAMAIKDLGLLVKVDTNGYNPVMLTALIDNGLVDYVAMDIKGPAHMYEEICGIPVDVEKIRTSIEILKTSNINYEFRTTVLPGLTEKDFWAIIHSDFKEVWGAKKYVFQQFRPGRNYGEFYKQAKPYSDATLRALQTRFQEVIEHVEIRNI